MLLGCNRGFPSCKTFSARVQCRRSLTLKAAPSTPQTVVPPQTAQSAEGYVRDPALQKALDDLLAATLHQGRRRVHPEDIKSHVERIEQLGSKLGLNHINPSWNDGVFRMLVTSQHVGISDQDECSLARLTFGKVAPADLMVRMGQEEALGLQGQPDQIKGPLADIAEDPARGYALVTYFKILSNGALGKMYSRALYDIDEQDPTKLHVTFVGLLLEPALRDEQSVALWKEALAPHNPNMAPDGSIYVAIEPRPRGTLRYILMEPDLHISISHTNSLSALYRIPYGNT